MKKQILFSVFIVLIAFGKTMAQTYVPVATTGYSLDGVAENTTAATTTGGALDDNFFVLYSQAYGALYGPNSSGVLPAGLPNNGTMVNGSRTYQLQSYTGFNTMHLLAGARDTLYFTTPQAFPSISLLGFGTQGGATLSVTVRFTDNSTQVFYPIVMDDWFSIASPMFSGLDRVDRTIGTPAYVGPAGNPKMAGADLAILCANQGKPIGRIIVKNTTAATSHAVIMAVSGAVPAYSVSGNPLVCSGSSTTLTATGFSSYTWQPVGTFAGANTASISVAPTSNTTYTLTGTSPSGCPGYTQVTVSVSGGTPTLSLAGSTSSVCLGAAATITASGALTYTLSSPAANGATFAPAATAVYTVTGANGCGSVTQTTSILVAPLPVTASTSSALVCAGSPATLSAGGATTYTWMPGISSQTNYVVSPTANTIYTLTGKTGNCTGTAQVTISTKPNPTLSISASQTAICNGDQVTLNVSGNAVTYTWTPGGPGTSVSGFPGNTILYSVTGTNSVNCVSTTQQVIAVNPLPVVNATVSNPLVCAGGSSTLAASGASTYVWTGGSGAATSTMVVNPTTDQSYTVTGTSSLSCSASTVVSVSIYSPSISLTSGTTICAGAAAMLYSGVADTYSWSNGQGIQNITVSPTLTTVYTLSASVNNFNGLSCLAINTVQVLVNPNPTVSATANRTIICVGETATLTATGAGATGTYTFIGGSGAIVSATTAVSPIADQTYTINGMDANGCKGKGTLHLAVSKCTGIDVNSAAASGLLVYPNPNNGSFTISYHQAITLHLVNELGQNVTVVKLEDANNYQASIDDLPAGIYFVKSAGATQVLTQKIVITK